MEQSVFYWTQSIYAIVGMLVFVMFGIILVLLYKKIVEMNKKLNILSEKAIETVDTTNDVLKNGKRLMFYAGYEFLKNFGRKKTTERRKYGCEEDD